MAGILAGAVCISAGLTAGPVKIKINEPGSLARELRGKEKKLAKAEALKLEGTLNNDDIRSLRELWGLDSLGNYTAANDLGIKSLDLERVDFSNTSIPYFFKTSKGTTYGVRGRNTLPDCMLYEIAITDLKLPARLDTLGQFSLAATRLEKIIIPDGVAYTDNAFSLDSLTSVLRLPDASTGLNPAWCRLSGLKSISYGNLDYMPSGSFRNLPELEEIIFEGHIGHIDGYQIENCPGLRRVIFKGPILTTGGRQFAKNCPELEEIRFEGLVAGLGLVDNPDCPRLKGITVTGAVLSSSDTATVPDSPLEHIKANPNLMNQFRELSDIMTGNMNTRGWMKRMALSASKDMRGYARELGLTDLADSMEAAYQANRDQDEGKSKLQILKESKPYKAMADKGAARFTYTPPTDSLLTLSREYFNLDSVAGNGDDVSRIKRLMYWVHDLVRHDGSSAWPDCPLNLRDLAKVCKDGDRGVNCRMMAIMLAEALLAEGIPARYLTCQPKAYYDDPDCHVINIAWAEDLGKWIWVDPTFAAFVTDDKGLPLHPGEVRKALIEGSPLVLNPDANWNHKYAQTKEDYLENYMAKNLYVISANSIQQAEPEGRSSHIQGQHIVLIPEGFDYDRGGLLTTDEEIFWQKP